METVKLNNGVDMPVIGLGTFPMNKMPLVKNIRRAVRAGYTAFDTSSAYQNEKSVGWGIKFCGKKREDLFITTKISNTQQYKSNATDALKDSLHKLKLSYVDLYLIHWPVPEKYLQTWKEMERLYEDGLVRAIGVCNFHQHHIEKLLEVADIMPAVNQIELHPLLSQNELYTYCAEKGIQIEAYTPIARMNEKLVKNETLCRIAAEHKKTVVQIVLRWDYQRGIIPIPKSANPDRLKENIDIFDFGLTEGEMSEINALNQNFRVRYDPDNCDFRKL